jgi:hypothetical protein
MTRARAAGPSDELIWSAGPAGRGDPGLSAVRHVMRFEDRLLEYNTTCYDRDEVINR